MTVTSRAVSEASITEDLQRLQIREGDVVVVRAALGAIGRVRREAFLRALLEAVGPEGTVMSLAFTPAAFINRADPEHAFTRATPSYAGALPNIMLAHPLAVRSRHPLNSFVAIGARAQWLLEGHGPESPSYEPIRRVIECGGKLLLVGCVASSPGFTTAHLAEYDLGHHRRIIMPWLTSVYYVDESGQTRLFRVRDSGMCSMSFSKFYSMHVEQGILLAGHVGQAYSVIVPAGQAYEIEKSRLQKEPQFNICDNPDCFICNMRRWDRIHRAPGYLFRNAGKIASKLAWWRKA